MARPATHGSRTARNQDQLKLSGIELWQAIAERVITAEHADRQVADAQRLQPAQAVAVRDVEGLGHCDLDGLHVVPVEDRLDDRVREPPEHQRLHWVEAQWSTR